jgi:hypothetical protein
MLRDRLVQALVGVTVLCFGPPSLAAEIRWSGDDSCRRESEVDAQVESATGRSVSSVEIADFDLRVKRLSREQWSLEMTTVRRADGARSTRTIRGATCVEVTDAAAVAIALAIGPSQTEPENEPKLRSEGEQTKTSALPEPPARSAATSAQPRKPPASSHDSLAWFAGLSAALDSSATPSPALGGSVRIGASWLPADGRKTGLRFELECALYAPTETSSVAGQAGKFQLAYGAPLVCGAKPLGETTLLLCAGAEFGQLSGEGVGEAVSASHPSNTFWAAARGELGLGYPREGALRAVGRVGLALPLVRRDFVLDGPEVVFRTAALSARVGLGVELSL